MCQRNITVASLAALEEMKEYIAGGDMRGGEPQTELGLVYGGQKCEPVFTLSVRQRVCDIAQN